MKKQISKTFETAQGCGKLIHCITNPISINLCANGILALGDRPIMVEHPGEVSEVTATASALLLNCGNITDARIKSMQIAAKTASDREIPIVFDVVGAACTELRRRLALKIIRKYSPDVVKGNSAEIYALYRKNYKSSGIDTDKKLSGIETVRAAKKLAAENKCVVMVSGKTDIITDGRRIAYVRNGTKKLSEITGTGCLLGAITAVMLTGGDAFSASVAACGVLGIAAEEIAKNTPNGSFSVQLIDRLSEMTAEKLEDHLRMEEYK